MTPRYASGTDLHMISEQQLILTNVSIYRSIADTAYRAMAEDMGDNVRHRPDGGPSVIKVFDPEQTSFKQAMISVVFTCIWLEATLHLLVVAKHGRSCFEKIDRHTYEGKLQLLNCRDAEVLNKVERLRKARKDLIHEKAHLEFNDSGEFTGTSRTAQEEAENARAVMTDVENWFGLAE